MKGFHLIFSCKCIHYYVNLQVYDKYGKELCVVATNLSTMCIEYFHPKTTPDVPVSLAVKCSAALPGSTC